MGSSELIQKDDRNGLIEIAEGILFNPKENLLNNKTNTLPISQLTTLGIGVSSLIPALRTITQKTAIDAHGFYQLANAGVGDTLKAAKNGNFWGAIKTAGGTSKMAQFKEASTITATSTTVVPIDPVTILMAAALFSIEQKLDKITEMEKQILSFLENEKESQIEADVITLTKIIQNYKFNWDNERFITSNHKLVLDIQRTARKDINSYQKKISNNISSGQSIITQAKANSTFNELKKDFDYYKLSLYTFSMSSFIEIILSGNFNEDYINGIISEIENLSMAYRELHGECSIFLEKMNAKSVETNVIKGVSAASKAIGNIIGSIPLIKEGKVDEFLQDSGNKIKKDAEELEEKGVREFARLNNPGTRIFLDKMKDVIHIYNHTNKICFDKENIYLIAE